MLLAQIFASPCAIPELLIMELMLITVFDLFSVVTTIELVGSCCTLVAEKLLAANFGVPPVIIDLLYCRYFYRVTHYNVNC